MSVFVARVARPSRVLPPEGDYETWLPFDARHPDTTSAGGADLAVWSWSAPLDRPLARGVGWGLVIDGIPHSSTDRIRAALGAGPPPGLDELPGSFSAVMIETDRLIAYAGISGEYPLFWAELDGYLLLSNRAAIVIAAAGAQVDPSASSWLSSLGYRPGGCGTFRGVRQLSPGERLAIRRRGTELHIRSDVLELGPLFETAEASAGELRDRIEGTLDRLAQSAAELPIAPRTHLQISGGMDSRSVLSIMAATAGLARIDELVTGGPPYSPDVLSARDVVSELGLESKHRLDTDPHSLSPHDAVRSILRTMRGTGCTVSLHDRSEDALAPDLLMLSGHQVLYRNSSLSGLPTGSFDEFAREAARHRLDPAGILRTSARAEMEQRRYADFVLFRERGVPTARMADVSNWLDRVAGWTGNIVSPHRAAHQHVNLLMDSPLIALSLSLPLVCIQGELIPFLMMQRFAPTLVGVPFAQRRWLPALGPALDRVGLPQAAPPAVYPYRVPPPLQQMSRAGPSGWSENALILLAPILRDLAGGHSSTIPHIDLDQLDARLIEVGAGIRQEPLATISLLGLATVLISAEYSTRLFDRGEEDAIADALLGRLEAGSANGSRALKPITSGRQLELRDEALAGFCVADRNQRQWAASVVKNERRTNPVRRAGGKLARRIRLAANRARGGRQEA